ncbi:unnamed protein product [Ambrosiozyma monospora]|uniref:Unnamed protein product n=1 Tax=Ambrosiozyma monospora TaxID=43982 RepID=A0ACB5T518_AMBMO|nr:unnamed protein product [Ambrosiozyma monospora]
MYFKIYRYRRTNSFSNKSVESSYSTRSSETNNNNTFTSSFTSARKLVENRNIQNQKSSIVGSSFGHSGSNINNVSTQNKDINYRNENNTTISLLETTMETVIAMMMTLIQMRAKLETKWHTLDSDMLVMMIMMMMIFPRSVSIDDIGIVDIEPNYDYDDGDDGDDGCDSYSNDSGNDYCDGDGGCDDYDDDYDDDGYDDYDDYDDGYY